MAAKFHSTPLPPSPTLLSRYRLRLDRQELPKALDTLQRPIQHVAEVVPILHNMVCYEPYEVCGAVYLDAAYRVTGYIVPYRGTLNTVTVETRGFILPALLSNAAALIVFHNHPGGDTRPSPNDLTLTWRLDEAAKTVGLRLLDHIILGDPPAYHSVVTTLLERTTPPKNRKQRETVEPKYRHPKTGETWSGMGFMARWLREAIRDGAQLEDFRIKS